MFKRNQSHLWK